MKLLRRHRPTQVVALGAVFVERFLLAPIAAVRSHFGAEAGAAFHRSPARAGELRFGVGVEIISASYECHVASEDDPTYATSGEAELTEV